MAPESRLTERGWHRKEAAALFNRVWRYLEQTPRTPAEVDAMIHAAHASRYHRSVVGKPAQFAIGDWQISHVYATLGRPEPAMYHGRLCLAVCRENRIREFAIVFAYEALARAASAAGRVGDSDRCLRETRAAAKGIRDEEDRKLLLSDLATIPRTRPRASSR